MGSCIGPILLDQEFPLVLSLKRGIVVAHEWDRRSLRVLFSVCYRDHPGIRGIVGVGRRPRSAFATQLDYGGQIACGVIAVADLSWRSTKVRQPRDAAVAIVGERVLAAGRVGSLRQPSG